MRDAGGVVAGVDADREVPAASVIKVLLLVAVLDEVEAGRRSLDERVAVPRERVGGAGALALLPSVTDLSLDELARLMICQSDNDAANVVLGLLGDEVVADVARRVGLSATHVRRAFMDEQARAEGRENTTTAADMALLLARLRGGEVVPFAQVRYAFELLADQQLAVGLTALLPEGVLHGSKPGELRGIRHDVAVIETADGAWASVAVLGTGMEDARYGQDYSVSVLPAFNAIGEAVLAYLTPADVS